MTSNDSRPRDRARGAVTRVRVLLLEDDAPLLGLLVELFTGEGLAVAVYETYAALRAAIRSGPTRVVVADFWGASQATLSECEADQIRELGRLVPTILLTGRAWASVVTVEELNLACIVPKPFIADDLLAKVRGCLGSLDDV